ncbi:UNVERIFIED_CONTAM: hypothetical protein FKN15_041521 [Acipenser sinensis]
MVDHYCRYVVDTTITEDARRAGRGQQPVNIRLSVMAVTRRASLTLTFATLGTSVEATLVAALLTAVGSIRAAQMLLVATLAAKCCYWFGMVHSSNGNAGSGNAGSGAGHSGSGNAAIGNAGSGNI